MEKLGVCDSGIGGLVVVDALRQAYPSLDIVYIGDQQNAPYGNKTVDELLEYGRRMLSYFEKTGIHHVLIACNTLCTNVFVSLQELFPNLKLYSIIAPTVNQLKRINSNRLLVIATSRTVESHSYRNYCRKIGYEGEIEEVACPKLVPLIEGNAELQLINEQVERDLLGKRADTILLGCTHFPLLRPYLSRRFQVIDSNQASVELVAKIEGLSYHGELTIYTSKDAGMMEKQIECLLHRHWKCEKMTF